MRMICFNQQRSFLRWRIIQTNHASNFNIPIDILIIRCYYNDVKRNDEKEVIIMIEFDGYGLSLNEMLKQMDADDAYRKSLQKVLNNGTFADYIDDFNGDVDKSMCPDVEWLIKDGNVKVYLTKASYDELGHTKAIAVLIDCVAEILWSAYSAEFDDADDYGIAEDEFLQTLKQWLNGHQRRLFRVIKEIDFD